MKNIYTITYKKAHNPNCTNYRNENRNVATRIITGEAEAKAFAETVEVICIRNYIGRKVSL